jgi:hypothetical protein
MSEGILGIPTVYRGVRFRSRTEACYACFFDLIDWRWEYEPLDLNAYIPDFVLRMHAPLLVEVKGAFSVDQLDPFRGKIERSGWDGEALLLAAAPLEDAGAAPVLGQLGERQDGEWLWSPARAFVCLSCGNVSVLAEDGDWRCRVCGVGDGNKHIGAVAHGHLEEWVMAKNRVQWRPGT